MKLSTPSHNSIVSAIQKALQTYASAGMAGSITDIYLQPNMESGELVIFNDDDQVLSSTVVNDWCNANPEDFYNGCELILKKVLNQLFNEGEFATLSIVKPFSFVLVDHEKETLAELLIVDEEETLFLTDELLKGLDDELNAFLKDLLKI
jgi:hypothetical protein